MDTIVICDLEVSYHVGVTDAERSEPQRLLLTLQIEHDFSRAAEADDLAGTINYDAVCQRLLRLGDGRSWKLLETLVLEIAALVRTEFGAARVSVEIKKFVIPQTRHVGVRVVR